MSADDLELRLKLWPRQLEAMNSPASEILFGGATEGGKSHFARVLLISLCLAIDGLQCCLIRKKYDDILKNHVEGPTGFNKLLAPLIQHKLVKVTGSEVRFLVNGSLIAFQHCQDERQFDSAQGVEKHVLVIDEATQIPERLIRFFRGWVRMPIEMKAKLPPEWREKLPLILYTANPIGTSVGFFRRNFVKARPSFSIEEVEGFKRQYIPSRATDNPSVDLHAHVNRLAGMGDAALARALDEGDWDSPIGEFFTEWSEEANRTLALGHVIPDFSPPDNWIKAGFRSLDLGYAEPTSVRWWCVSDGKNIMLPEGKSLWLPKGALVSYKEWYICDPENPAKGLRLGNEEIAEGILLRSQTKVERDFITVTDSLPFQDRGHRIEGNKKYTVANVFADCGVPLIAGNTERISGWSQVRTRLRGIEVESSKLRYPMIYFMASCKAAREYIPALPRHKTKLEDAADSGEATHACDEIRLACTLRTLAIDAPVSESKIDFTNEKWSYDEIINRIQLHKNKSIERW